MNKKVEANDLYKQSQGVCLKHLSLLIDTVKDNELKELLLSTAISLFEQDAEDMRGFALKNDALRKGLQNMNEKDAYRRMVVRLAGDKRVVMPWAEDGTIG